MLDLFLMKITNIIDECLYKLLVIQKCYIFIELTFLKELMLIKQLHQNSVIFVTICIFKTKFEFQPYECSKCHDLLLMSMNLSNVAILRIKTINYCIITGISKFEAMKLLLKIS